MKSKWSRTLSYKGFQRHIFMNLYIELWCSGHPLDLPPWSPIRTWSTICPELNSAPYLTKHASHGHPTLRNGRLVPSRTKIWTERATKEGHSHQQQSVAKSCWRYFLLSFKPYISWSSEPPWGDPWGPLKWSVVWWDFIFLRHVEGRETRNQGRANP